MRTRSLVTVLALAAGTLALAGGTAVAARLPLTPSISCDPAAGAVTARLDGGGKYLLPNQAVTVSFRVQAGSSVPVGGDTPRSLPQVGQTTPPVAARTDAEGNLSVAGYRRAWRAADFAFYTETVRVTIGLPDGSVLTTVDARCDHDPRDTVTATCDPVARTVTATTTGVRHTPSSYVTVQYRLLWARYQNTPTSERMTTWWTNPNPTYSHWASTDAAGAWSDTGFVQPTSTTYYYELHFEVTVVGRNLAVIGRGTGSCSMTTG